MSIAKKMKSVKVQIIQIVNQLKKVLKQDKKMKLIWIQISQLGKISQRVHLSRSKIQGCPKTWQLKKRHDELNNLKKEKLIDKIIKLEDALVEEIKIKENCLVSFNIEMH